MKINLDKKQVFTHTKILLTLLLLFETKKI